MIATVLLIGFLGHVFSRLWSRSLRQRLHGARTAAELNRQSWRDVVAIIAFTAESLAIGAIEVYWLREQEHEATISRRF